MPTRSRTSFLARRILSPIKAFIRDSRAVGITLICCTIISLALSNSGPGQSYLAFWDKDVFHLPDTIRLPHSLLHIINDGLMAIFFLMAGMEIKRELLAGELATRQKAMLPVIAALGGMVLPAFFYYLWCGNTPYSAGWGIPMATDIAFSLGVLSLLGKKAPLSLRIFLTALAIIDDLGGILTIALFYAGDINWIYLGLAAFTLAVLITMNLLKLRLHFLYLIPGLLLWYFMLNSGVHATIAGILIAFCIPLHRIEKLIHALHYPVSFVILPLFALANTAIALPGDFTPVFTSPIHHGILSGLFLGKPVGILVFSFIAVKLGIATLPSSLKWKHIAGVGLIAGIGFTMSIFIAVLAFPSVGQQLIAKVAIIAASFLSGIAGYVFLAVVSRKQSVPAK
jgi:NhaA family Na+:H+ antiporter